MPSPPRYPWRLRTAELLPDRLPRLMGIINVTPDSFSDGGRFLAPEAAIEHGLRLASEGADMLDVGGQSTRPGAVPVEPKEELRRVLPVIAGLARQTSVPISVDTTNARVAAETLAAGAEAINDITALTGDPAMPALAAQWQCGVCAMHMQGTPQTMQRDPTYNDVVDDVLAYLNVRRQALVAAGIEPERLALDPGIGFGKTTEHNLSLLRAIGRFHDLRSPLVVGLSRKRFIGQLLGDLAADRTPGTLGAALAMAQQGVEILRVHDVAAVRQALLLFDAVGGLAPAAET